MALTTKVTPPGCCCSKWTLTYSVYNGDLSSGHASVQGNVVKFKKGDYLHQSSEIDERPEIASQGGSGQKYVVKLKYTGDDLDRYFRS